MSDFGHFKRFASELKHSGVSKQQRRIILENIRDNFVDFGSVRISQTTRERSFWRRWGRAADGSGADEVGRYGTIGPRSAGYSRDQLAVRQDWNTLQHQTRFRIRRGSLLVEGKTAPKIDVDGRPLPGGGHQVFVPNLQDLTR